MEEGTEGTDAEQEAEGGGGLNVEVLKSYLGFAGRAIKKRKLLIGLVVVVGMTLTITVAKYLPRTYACSTVMMTVANTVLDQDRGVQPLAGAENQILRHENLEALIRDTHLKKTYAGRRPPLLALKDRLITAVFGPMDDKILNAMLVGTLESKLAVTTEKETLTISVEWSDSQTAAELTEATREGFLRIRHRAEISAFQEKMGILDSHAALLRDEIETLAAQLKQDLKAKRAERAAERAAEKKESGRSATPTPVRVLSAPAGPVSDEQLPGLRERLMVLKQRLAGAENDREQRMRAEQAKLDELKLRLTPSHPQVITQEGRVGMASQVSSEVSQMRAEVADIESQIRQREAMVKTGRPSSSRTVFGDSPTSEPLPSEILGLLDQKDADPALTAQMSGAVVRYGALRDEVRGAKLALDTAQAAFSHRYQVVIPVEEPNRPIKPKVPAILGGGLVASLLLAFLLPILLELRRDLVIERWQVQHFSLPVLGELRLPHHRDDP